MAKQTKLPVVKFKKLHPRAVVPKKHTNGSVGLDLHVIDDYVINPTNTTQEAYMLETGLAVAIPEGYHGKIFLRSSTGKKTKLRLANGTGIIDSDYRGQIMLLVENVGAFRYFINRGERLFQMLIEKNAEYEISEEEDLDETDRGSGGIGSTGKD